MEVTSYEGYMSKFSTTTKKDKQHNFLHEAVVEWKLEGQRIGS